MITLVQDQTSTGVQEYRSVGVDEYRSQRSHIYIYIQLITHLVLVKGSPGLVRPQLGGEPQCAGLGDVGCGGGEARVHYQVLPLTTRHGVD